MTQIRKPACLTADEVREMFRSAGAIVPGHFVMAGGAHTDTILAKAKVLAQLEYRERIVEAFAEVFAEPLPRRRAIDVVVGPESGAALLAQRVAQALSKRTGRDIAAITARKDPNRRGRFFFERGNVLPVSGKSVLVVEDILTTGGTSIAVIELVHLAGGSVEGFGAIWNRGGVSPHSLGAPALFCELVREPLPAWRRECPLCKAAVPFSHEYGHAKNFAPAG